MGQLPKFNTENEDPKPFIKFAAPLRGKRIFLESKLVVGVASKLRFYTFFGRLKWGIIWFVDLWCWSLNLTAKAELGGISTASKDQLISKSFFGVFNFFQKTNKNKSHSSKVEFIRSFFGRNISLKKLFRLCQTFKISISRQ